MSSNKSFRGKMCDGGGVLRKMRISPIHLSTLGGDSSTILRVQNRVRGTGANTRRVGQGRKRIQTQLKTNFCAYEP
jgi:hypothetical protein